MALIVLFILSAAGFWLWRTRRQAAPRLVFNSAAQKLTNFPGEELYPSLAPDGQSIIFASAHNGNWDIYRQGVGDRGPVNLTAGADSYDTQPAYSPDGARIAFRSSRSGAGIFLMDADGSNVSQLTQDGFNPAWSPDGSELALNDDNPSTYEGRNTFPSASKLWAINVTTRARV